MCALLWKAKYEPTLDHFIDTEIHKVPSILQTFSIILGSWALSMRTSTIWWFTYHGIHTPGKIQCRLMPSLNSFWIRMSYRMGTDIRTFCNCLYALVAVNLSSTPHQLLWSGRISSTYTYYVNGSTVEKIDRAKRLLFTRSELKPDFETSFFMRDICTDVSWRASLFNMSPWPLLSSRWAPVE